MLSNACGCPLLNTNRGADRIRSVQVLWGYVITAISCQPRRLWPSKDTIKGDICLEITHTATQKQIISPWRTLDDYVSHSWICLAWKRKMRRKFKNALRKPRSHKGEEHHASKSSAYSFKLFPISNCWSHSSFIQGARQPRVCLNVMLK